MHAYKASFLAFAISMHPDLAQLNGPCGLEIYICNQVCEKISYTCIQLCEWASKN